MVDYYNHPHWRMHSLPSVDHCVQFRHPATGFWGLAAGGVSPVAPGVLEALPGSRTPETPPGAATG